MEVGEWLNIHEHDARRYSNALWRYTLGTDQRFICRPIDVGVYRIMRYY